MCYLVVCSVHFLVHLSLNASTPFSVQLFLIFLFLFRFVLLLLVSSSSFLLMFLQWSCSDCPSHSIPSVRCIGFRELLILHFIYEKNEREGGGSVSLYVSLIFPLSSFYLSLPLSINLPHSFWAFYLAPSLPYYPCFPQSIHSEYREPSPLRFVPHVYLSDQTVISTAHSLIRSITREFVMWWLVCSLSLIQLWWLR